MTKLKKEYISIEVIVVMVICFCIMFRAIVSTIQHTNAAANSSNELIENAVNSTGVVGDSNSENTPTSPTVPTYNTFKEISMFLIFIYDRK